jgi:hypothetical protein
MVDLHPPQSLLLPPRLLRNPHPLPRRPTTPQFRPRSYFALRPRVRRWLAPREVSGFCLREEICFEGFRGGGVGVQSCGAAFGVGGGWVRRGVGSVVGCVV